jgi:manganese/zinc/iron transport system substrate-binding protein
MAVRKPVFAVADGIPLDRILKSGEFPDPHVWMDVELWRCGLDVVESRLAELRPQWNGEFQRRAADYRRELDALHRECLDAVKTVPAPQRVLVTAHDAFQYFGRAYGVEVRAIQGISTESEASVQQINALVDFLVERKIRAVFVESSVSERNVEALREGCRSRGHKVRIGGDLYSDAMGDEGTPEGTYPGMIRHNVRTIVSALRAGAM